jgi:ubiquinone/menaquinone biosynthesis C-methylase UbiE
MKKKFNPAEIDKLRDPRRLETENPSIIWGKLGLGDSACIVDVGCGAGFSAIPFAKKTPGGKVYACDISPEMLDAITKEIESSGVANVFPLLVDEAKIPLEDGIADALLMQNIHHELHSAEESLLECKRVLRPGGKIVVVDWKKDLMDFGPPLNIRVSAKKIGSDLREAGFVQIDVFDLLPYHSFIVARKP